MSLSAILAEKRTNVVRVACLRIFSAHYIVFNGYFESSIPSTFANVHFHTAAYEIVHI